MTSLQQAMCSCFEDRLKIPIYEYNGAYLYHSEHLPLSRIHLEREARRSGVRGHIVYLMMVHEHMEEIRLLFDSSQDLYRTR